VTGRSEPAARPKRRGWQAFTHAAWWVHVLVTLAALLVLNVIGLVIAAVFFVNFVSEHGPVSSEIPRQSAVPADEANALARRFAPILKLDSRELFVPIRQAAYVGETQLKEEEGRFVKLVEAAPAVDKLPAAEGRCLRSRGCQYFLDVRGVEPHPPKHSERAYADLERHLLRIGERPTVHVHVTRYEDSGDYAVQYWFLYLFNYRLNEHESDWEQITVRLDEDKTPIDALYSAHAGGHLSPWSEIETEGDHPVAYPALGSHANYFKPGRHRVEIVCKRLVAAIRACFKGRKVVIDLANGAGERLDRNNYKLSELTGPVFVGSYGSGNYVVLTRKADILADPRARAAWRDPLSAFR
jgi:hypothetical protein